MDFSPPLTPLNKSSRFCFFMNTWSSQWNPGTTTSVIKQPTLSLSWSDLPNAMSPGRIRDFFHIPVPTNSWRCSPGPVPITFTSISGNPPGTGVMRVYSARPWWSTWYVCCTNPGQVDERRESESDLQKTCSCGTTPPGGHTSTSSRSPSPMTSVRYLCPQVFFSCHSTWSYLTCERRRYFCGLSVCFDEITALGVFLQFEGFDQGRVASWVVVHGQESQSGFLFDDDLTMIDD